MSAARSKELDARWIILSGQISALLLAGVGIYYGSFTVPLGPAKTTLMVVGPIIAVLMSLTYQLRVNRRLATLGRLWAGTLRPNVQSLQAAVREVSQLPDFQFRGTIEHWVVGAGALAAGVYLWAGAPAAGALRLVLIAALLAPTSALLSQVLATLRTRQTLLRLSELGLTPRQVVEAVPPKRQSLVWRLSLFTVIAALTPVLLTAELASVGWSNWSQSLVEGLTPQARIAVVTQARWDLLFQVGSICILMGLVALLGAFLIGTALGSPVSQVAHEAAQLALGDVSEPRIIPAEDEVWAVAAAFTGMQEGLGSVLAQLKGAGARIGSTSEQLVATSVKFESNAAEQAAALNETSATTEELARSAAQIAENAAAVAASAERTLSSAQEGQTGAEAFTQSMARMREDNRSIRNAVHKLSKRVVQIGRIVEFINGIADKSDLLALSAELEGTKAGDVGRGFGLVASEMRRLAENVLESTREIEELIREIREATQAAVQATDAGVRATDEGARFGAQVNEGLAVIVGLAQQTTEAVRSISLATQQQQNGTDQLVQSMTNILRVTQENVQASREAATRNSELSEVAQRLKAAVDRFEAGSGA